MFPLIIYWLNNQYIIYLPCGIFAWRDVESLLCYAVGTYLFVKMSYLTVPIFSISLLNLVNFLILSAL